MIDKAATEDYCTVSDDCLHHPVLVDFRYGTEVLCEDCGMPMDDEECGEIMTKQSEADNG